MSLINETTRDGMLLDTPDKIGDGYTYYSSSNFDRHHDRHHYHPFKRSNKGYFPDGFKKEKAPTFDGDVNKPEDVEVWILGMKNFFELYEYTDNMKERIIIFSFVGFNPFQCYNTYIYMPKHP